MILGGEELLLGGCPNDRKRIKAGPDYCILVAGRGGLVVLLLINVLLLCKDLISDSPAFNAFTGIE